KQSPQDIIHTRRYSKEWRSRTQGSCSLNVEVSCGIIRRAKGIPEHHVAKEVVKLVRSPENTINYLPFLLYIVTTLPYPYFFEQRKYLGVNPEI
ncbi:7759_t:CDS:2, partial [Gigaspora rosea]